MLLNANLLSSRLVSSKCFLSSSIEPSYPQGYPQPNQLIDSEIDTFYHNQTSLPKCDSRLCIEATKLLTYSQTTETETHWHNTIPFMVNFYPLVRYQTSLVTQ